METGQSNNKPADLSDYLKSAKPAAIAVYPPLDAAQKKKKIYILIIVICSSLSAVFWSIYFKQSGGGANQKMNLSQTVESSIPGPEN